MKNIRNFPEFTHFASLPFIRNAYREQVKQLQQEIYLIFKAKNQQKCLNLSSSNLIHLTLSMLTLNLEKNREETKKVLERMYEEISLLMKNTTITFKDIGYFTKYNTRAKKNYVTLFYLDLENDEALSKLIKLTDLFIREMLKSEIISENQLKSMHIKYDHNDNLFKNGQFHLTLFRINQMEENQEFIKSFEEVRKNMKPMKFDCDFFDISTRGRFDQTRFYQPLSRVIFGQKKVI